MTKVIGIHGSVVDFSDIENSKYEIDDIAHRLSRIQRFNGGTIRPWSVAQHSIALYELAKLRNGNTYDLLCCLLHDSAEAFMGDIVSPLKPLITGFSEMETLMADTIGKVIVGGEFSPLGSKLCKILDTTALAGEWYVANGNRWIQHDGVIVGYGEGGWDDAHISIVRRIIDTYGVAISEIWKSLVLSHAKAFRTEAGLWHEQTARPLNG